MARDYQRNSPYKLPHTLYKRVKYMVKDYDRMKAEYVRSCYEPLRIAHGAEGSGAFDPTGSICSRPEVNKYFDDMHAIEQALQEIPLEYQKGVFDEARYGCGFPIDAGQATYKRWKQRFIYHVAKNLNLL